MLRIAGDINLTDGFFDTGIGTGSHITEGKDPFCHLERHEDDYWIGNMECVCADTSCQSGLKRKQFIISPNSLGHIRHFNFYGVANNHVMQHGADAYHAMCQYFESQHIAYAGSDDKRTYQFVHQGKNIGIMVFCMRPENFSKSPVYWYMPEYTEVKRELQGLAKCDYKIVYVHWGNEFINYPYIDQKQFAHFLIDEGADLIVGMHPHVLQGFEHYKHGYIFYSLGNFVFNMPWESTKYSIIVNVDLKGSPVVSYEYVKIGLDFFPHPAAQVPPQFTMEHLNTLLDINLENEKYYRKVFAYNKQYKKANRKQIAKNFMHMRLSDSMGIIREFIIRKTKKS